MTICGICLRAGGRVTGLDAMRAALPGRPSDAWAAWIEGRAGLGWRGETDAHRARPLPLVDREAGLAVTASARLDDRGSLCEALDVPRPERRSLPDAALILRAYRRWGVDCPDRLLGDFAFAVWDRRRRRLFCARDHAGARPFHYCLTAGRIVFASDVGAVLAAPGVSDALDERVVAGWLYGWRCFGDRTFFRDVRRLPPGHLLAVEGDAARVERWWRPEDARPAPPAGDDARAEALLEILGRAVADRVPDRQPVGVHLSGGLDSSSVAVLAARALRRRGRAAPPAFSWQPPPGDAARGGPPAQEHRLIEAVARREGLRVLYCPPRAEDRVAHLRRDVARFPVVGASEQAVRRRAAERGVRVLLSGWGGDEGISFNGRGAHEELLLRGRWGRLWRETGEKSRRPLASIAANVALPLATRGAAQVVRRLRGR